MSNVEPNSPLNEPTGAMTNNSEITKREKIIIGILLFIMGLLLIALGQKILPSRLKLSTGNNRLMVSARSYFPIWGSDPIQYVFSLERSKKADIEIFSNLPESAELSPDGQWIVFGTVERNSDDFSSSEIYIMRTDGTQKTHVPIPEGGREPTWSPDGKQIAFVGYVSKTGIYIANIECILRGESCIPTTRLLVAGPIGYPLASPDWSPDGSKIAYTGLGQRRISVIHADGYFQPVELPSNFSGTFTDPQWSPDGTKIVGICQGDISGVCVMNSDGSNLVYLKEDTKGQYTDQPRWSPDGQMIAFVSTFSNRQIPQSCFPDGCASILRASTIFIMNTDGSAMTHLPYDDNVVTQWFFWYP